MKILSNAGNHSLEVIETALQKAMEMNTDIVVSSSTGKTALMIQEEAKKIGFNGKIVVVATAATAASKGVNRFDKAIKENLKKEGIAVVVAGHALSSGERGISAKHKGISPLEIMAETLRTMGQGTKVCFECAVMALDADELEYGKPIVSLGGTGGGLDTGLVITPSYSSTILDTVIHEFLIKPFDISRPKKTA